ncbi:MAG: glutamate synthase-related protein, partial [Candidatus Latescibacterota bacterium]
MPAKYAIHTRPAPPRWRPVGKLGIVDWREDCAGCHHCVKRACVYGLYRDEAETLRREVGYLDYIYQCKGCLNCVQNCTKGILTRVVNPEYRCLGDSYYTPDIVLATWYQAESGRIPVSGSGYGGPFSGPGFDSMWTDMSEIVRPTRDGIHGREYISTSVDVGRKLPYLRFADGELASAPSPLLEVPLPVLFDLIAAHWRRGAVMDAVLAAAAQIGTLAVLDPEEAERRPEADPRHVVPLCATAAAAGSSASPLVMLDDGPEVMAAQARIKEVRPEAIVAIRLPATPAVAARTAELAGAGAEVLHLVFDRHGRELVEAVVGNRTAPRHARDVLRQVHTGLVRQGLRDEVTLVAAGGIAQAEHVAKALICGADLVAVDVPLL